MSAVEKEAAARDLLAHLAAKPPHWQAEDRWFQVREPGQRYFVISELDAGRLEAVRELALALTSPA